MKLHKTFLSSIAIVVAVGMLSSCAQYKVSTDHVKDYQGHIEKLSIWSGIVNVPTFGFKGRLESDTFSNRFDAALAHAFLDENINVVIHDIPQPRQNELNVNFNLGEQEFHPDTRLLIQPVRYQILNMSGGIGGSSSEVARLWLNLILVDLRGDVSDLNKKVIWRGSIFVDNSGLDLTVWKTAGAEKLSKQIIDALKKDKFL